MSAEEVLDAVEAVDAVIVTKKHGYLAMGLLFVGGLALGAGVAHAITKKKVTEEYEERIDEEIRNAVAYLVKHEQLGPKDVVVSDEPDVDLPDEAVEGGTVVFKDEKPPLADLAQKNLATRYDRISTDEGYASDQELVTEEPYQDPDITIISKDLFLENVSEFPQETLTFFSDGGVLDISGDFVEVPEAMIGAGIPHFGEMSEDANIVYIRNKRLEKEFEVISDPGKASDFADPEGSLTTPGEQVSEELMHSLQDKYPPSFGRR